MVIEEPIDLLSDGWLQELLLDLFLQTEIPGTLKKALWLVKCVFIYMQAENEAEEKKRN